MSDRPASPLDRYLAHRRRYEIGFWFAYWLMHASLNSIDVVLALHRSSPSFEDWEPVVWEFSSCLMLLALVPAVLLYERRFPLRWQHWRRSAALHLAGSLAFSLSHVAGMVGLRALAYAAMNSRYDFGDWPRELLYEYLKDVRSYVYMLAILYAYRLLLLRLQGEARLLAEPEEGAPVEPIERPERFLVRKLGKDFLVAARDVEWLEAAENYVNLHVRGHAYPLRSTMSAIEQRLDPERFLRVHRRYIVNLDQIAHIEPLDTGDARLLLKDGAKLPCSRTYRAALKTAVVR
ncbi:LytTR family DNA-binding domain-containing protein [Hydrocarboniphaga sp.]|uniref:LytTR family DNA-binding domain-containing protein n=1 Tax=Hydrocarboniphaga sp. TaxID=2033016 RepID=UPI002635B0D9|nr:LytTR family DNA-binding domain-containing protein [Hydrocarboniphaga sp.]